MELDHDNITDPEERSTPENGDPASSPEEERIPEEGVKETVSAPEEDPEASTGTEERRLEEDPAGETPETETETENKNENEQTEEPACDEEPQPEGPARDEEQQPEELLLSGDVPQNELKDAEEALHPVKKTLARLKAVSVLLTVICLLLAAAVTALAFVAIGINKKVNKLEGRIPPRNTVQNTTANADGSGDENYVPIVLPDTTSANAAVINVATVCSPSVVTLKITTGSGSGSGSGVVYSSDGYIITNNHVVEDAVSIKVVFVDGSTYSATVIGTDPDNDLALVRINATGLTPVTFGDSDKIMVGELAVAIGNPLGTLANTVTDGIVSALARNINIDGTVYHVMQISCAINPGNSGGGCFNAKGELIGIVNAKKQQSGIEGLGFAIPVNTVKTSIGKIAQEDKTTLQKSVGVTSCYEVTAENYDEYNKSYLSRIEKANDGKPIYGLYIYGDGNVDYVDSKNTLVNGDILISVDGKNVTTIDEIGPILADKEEGDVITLKVCRLVSSGFWGSETSIEEKEVKVRVVYMYR